VRIQREYDLPAYKEKSKAFVQSRILEKLPASDLKRSLLIQLFERDYTAIREEINAFRKEKGKRTRRKPPRRK